MGKAKYKKQSSGVYAQDIVRHKNVRCTSNNTVKWCKKYLNRWYRRTTKNKNKENREYYKD